MFFYFWQPECALLLLNVSLPLPEFFQNPILHLIEEGCILQTHVLVRWFEYELFMH
ncbi:hypothetical protein KP13_01447 (plasmid) [Klebsiella pneumoniae subsp. pneumoniae Kp13]|nr:hypothetical protein KP13_01447 [Klebsiella pneumoniae subsp. pneumoniae Kp13]